MEQEGIRTRLRAAKTALRRSFYFPLFTRTIDLPYCSFDKLDDQGKSTRPGGGWAQQCIGQHIGNAPLQRGILGNRGNVIAQLQKQRAGEATGSGRKAMTDALRPEHYNT